MSWNASAAETADCPASIAGSLHNILAVQLTSWPWLWSSPSPPSNGRNFIMALPLRYDSTEETPYCRFKKPGHSPLVLCGARMIPGNLADGMGFASYCHSISHKSFLLLVSNTFRACCWRSPAHIEPVSSPLWILPYWLLCDNAYCPACCLVTCSTQFNILASLMLEMARQVCCHHAVAWFTRRTAARRA